MTYYYKSKIYKAAYKRYQGFCKYYDENVDFHLKNEIAKL